MDRGRMRVSEALYRSARSITIGFASAAAFWGSVSLWQYHTRVTQANIPDEWTFLTKFYTHKGLENKTLEGKVKWYSRAVENLVNLPGGQTVDLSGKSQAWLSGYADLVRRLGLAQAQLGQDAREPLEAGTSIPFGDKKIRREACTELYHIIGDKGYLLQAIRVADPRIESLQAAKVPPKLDYSESTPFIDLGKLEVQQSEYKSALNILLGVHKALDPQDDTTCIRASVAGLIGQVLWKLHHQEESRTWLKLSVDSSRQSKTTACVECHAMALALLSKAST